MKKYYVYEYWNPAEDKPFYVGKGTSYGKKHSMETIERMKTSQKARRKNEVEK